MEKIQKIATEKTRLREGLSFFKYLAIDVNRLIQSMFLILLS